MSDVPHPVVSMDCSEAECDLHHHDSYDMISSEDSSDSLSDSDAKSSCSSMDDEGFPEDPSNPVMTENSAQASAHRSTLFARLNNQCLARPMHEGDDEGRDQASIRHFVPAHDNDADVDEENPRMATAVAVPARPRFVVAKCWLCMFANSNTAKQITTFVGSHASTMDPAIMAQQIKAVVMKQYPRSVFLHCRL